MSSFILGPQRFGEISLVTRTLEPQRAAAMHSIYAPPLGVHRRCLENLADSQQGNDELNVSIRVAVSKVGCSMYSALQRTQGKILLPNENITLPPPLHWFPLLLSLCQGWLHSQGQRASLPHIVTLLLETDLHPIQAELVCVGEDIAFCLSRKNLIMAGLVNVGWLHLRKQ